MNTTSLSSGSQTAKRIFHIERVVANKFNSWKTDRMARSWLETMHYNLDEIEEIRAEVLLEDRHSKTDVSVRVTVKGNTSVENLSVKSVGNPRSGSNQLDKRKIDNYVKLWSIPEDVATTLKRFTGELPPTISNPRDRKGLHMYINEFPQNSQKRLIDFIKHHQNRIVNDLFTWHGEYKAKWFMAIQNDHDCDVSYGICNENGSVVCRVLKEMGEVIDHYNSGEIKVTKRGGLHIGKITIQRKGGDAGKPTANMLQFKINPLSLIRQSNHVQITIKNKPI